MRHSGGFSDRIAAKRGEHRADNAGPVKPGIGIHFFRLAMIQPWRERGFDFRHAAIAVHRPNLSLRLSRKCRVQCLNDAVPQQIRIKSVFPKVRHPLAKFFLAE